MTNKSTNLETRCNGNLVSTTHASSDAAAKHVADACREHADDLEAEGCVDLAAEYRAVANTLDPI